MGAIETDKVAKMPNQTQVRVAGLVIAAAPPPRQDRFFALGRFGQSTCHQARVYQRRLVANRQPI
jgi:hypothetical protein